MKPLNLKSISRRALGPLLACAFGALWGAPAWAVTADANGDQSRVLVLLAVVAGAYLISYLLLGWLTRRFGLVMGVQYILLGIAIGPAFSVLDSATLAGFEPLVALAVGAMGMLAGLEFNVRRLAVQEGRALKIASLVTVATLLLVVGVPMLFLHTQLGAENLWRWMPIVLGIGAISLVADPRHLAGLLSYFEVDNPVSELANNVNWLCTVLAVLVFGILFCAYNPGTTILAEHLGWVQWLVAHIAVGTILGTICGALVQLRPDDERLMTILIGTVVLASGLAYTTTLSLVFVNFIAGFVIINMSDEAMRVQRMFVNLERPLYVILLFFVGTGLVWNVSVWVYVLVLVYLVLRYLGRWAGVMLYRPSVSGFRPDPGIHRALWAPGGLSAAMILDFFGVFGEVLYADAAMTGFIAVLIASEIVAFILARGWVIDISDVTSDRRDRKRGQ
ncbi:MAG: hypothetical protein H0U74_05365 [Bradymonadaceae bacterium]|nr:hypothetical protein [Lujinxingiaceae bacterium]